MILIYLAFLFLTIYVMISMVSFFKSKTRSDKELLYKLDELIKLQTPKKEP
jgi:hypothetical protein